MFQSTLPTRGSDGDAWIFDWLNWRFQSTLPTRGSDECKTERGSYNKGFNPRSPRGGATIAGQARGYLVDVSIHAPHEGERRIAGFYFFAPRPVSIHAPHEGERRYLSTDDPVLMPGFNPRSPRGGATQKARGGIWFCSRFNPRSPRGGATCIHNPR